MYAAAGVALPAGVVTIVEGDAMVLRDSTRLPIAEGLRLRADDIVATADSARLVRIELDDGKVLDLGPATQLMLQPRLGTRDAERAPALYVMQGWVKLTSPAGAPATATLATPRADATRITGNLIVAVLRESFWLFAESGRAEVWRRRDGGGTPAQPLQDGDSYTWRAPGPGSLSRMAPAELRSQVPRAFVDTLPRRAARFAGVAVEPGRAVEVSYGDIAAWINGEPALRAALVRRLTARAREPVFRSALVAEMKLHPEWQPVLFPPPPKRAPEPEGGATPLLGQITH